MGTPLPLDGANPFNLGTGQTLYQTRQFFVGSPYCPTGVRGVFGANVTGTPGSLASLSTSQQNSTLVNPLEEETEFFGLYVQTVTETGSPTGGWFSLGYSGLPTALIPQAASAVTLETAINLLSNIPAPTGTKTNAQQSLTITGAPTSAIVHLNFANTTTIFNWTPTSTAASLQTVMGGQLGAANIAVSGAAGGPYTITFQGILGWAPQSLITTTGTSFTGGTSPTAAVASVTTGVTPTYAVTATGATGGPWTVNFGTPFTSPPQPVALLSVLQNQLTGGNNPDVVVTSTSQQQGFIPF